MRRTHELVLLSGAATASTRTCSGVCTSAVMAADLRSAFRSPAEAQKRPHMPLRRNVAASEVAEQPGSHAHDLKTPIAQTMARQAGQAKSSRWLPHLNRGMLWRSEPREATTEAVLRIQAGVGPPCTPRSLLSGCRARQKEVANA